MSEEIKVYEDELASAVYMLRGCGQEVEAANTPAPPSQTGISPAMDAFLFEAFALEATVNEYLQVLHNDLAALEAAQSALAEADRASATAMEG